jgi:hypothetical protein
MATPRISVVIVRFAGGPAIVAVLESLGGQQTDRDELLVAHGPSHLPEAALRARFPAVRWIASASDDPAVQRAAGMREARAPIIACLEDHCVPDAAWLENVLRAHARSTAVVIGGAIEKRTPDDAHAWAAYLMEYGRYMPPLRAGPTDACSDCNVSYKKEKLLEIGDVWQAVFRETEVHGALKARGAALELDPSIIVAQSRKIDPLKFFAERREHGRTYGAQRAQGSSPIARALRATRALLLPVVFVRRGRGRVAAAGRSAEVPPEAWAVLARASAYWAIGEALGELTGRTS